MHKALVIDEFIEGTGLHLAVHIKGHPKRNLCNLYFLEFGLACVHNVIDANTFHKTINNILVMPVVQSVEGDEAKQNTTLVSFKNQRRATLIGLTHQKPIMLKRRDSFLILVAGRVTFRARTAQQSTSYCTFGNDRRNY